MKQEYFEIVVLVLKIALLILSAFVVPALTKWLKSNTTEKQREDALFWIKTSVKIAESIYKERGQGNLKKEYVLEWLNKNKISITKEQADILIDLVVQEFNKNGWNTNITNTKQSVVNVINTEEIVK